MAKLTDKQEMFCLEYIACKLNATKAAINAGYSENGARQIGSENLSKIDIQNRIAELNSARVERLNVKAEDLVKQMDNLRKAKISDYVELMTEIVIIGEDDEGEPIKKGVQRLVFKDFEDLTEDQILRIEGIKEGKNGIELKLHGIEWNIEKLNKYTGVYEKDNKQKEKIIVSTQDRDDRIQELLDKAKNG